MKITSIKNKNTNIDVCSHYLHKELDMSKTVIIVNNPLLVVYEKGSFFNHEKVINVEHLENGSVKVETQNKIWVIQ